MQKNIFIRFGGRYMRLELDKVLYFEAERNFVKIHYSDNDFLLLMSMRQLEKDLPAFFCRVHRSYIVNLDQIQSFDADQVWFDKEIVPVSRYYRDHLLNSVRVIRADSKSVATINTEEIKILN